MSQDSHKMSWFQGQQSPRLFQNPGAGIEAFWWPSILNYIHCYIQACDLCLYMKHMYQLPFGELQLTETPQQPWECISVNFIVEPPDSHGYDTILMVVDSLTKHAHFMATHTTVGAEGLVNLYLQHVWKHHGLPDKVISDCGLQFISHFMKELSHLLGIHLAPSTTYHPQTDGQTECINTEVEQYIWLFTSEQQDNWDYLLPMAEFVYNNHIHSTTQKMPFELDSSHIPWMGFEPQAESTIESANEFRDCMASVLEEAWSTILKAKDNMTRYYNYKQQPLPDYAISNQVYLDASHIHITWPSAKLAHCFLGPYQVSVKVGTNTYHLLLLKSMLHLHPIFYVSKLCPMVKDTIPGWQSRPLPPPEIRDDGEYYIVEEILDSWVWCSKLEFKVWWEGYGPKHDQWIPKKDLVTPDLLHKFYDEHLNAPQQINGLLFQSCSVYL